MINNFILVVEGGVGLGLTCLLEGEGEDFSVLFLKVFCSSPILSTTLHTTFFFASLSKLNLVMQYHTSSFSTIKFMTEYR